MGLNVIGSVIPSRLTSGEHFPLTRVPQVRVGLQRLIQTESEPAESRDQARTYEKNLSTLNVPCATFFPKACKHSAAMAWQSGTWLGMFVAICMRLWPIAWPLAYVACWLAEKAQVCPAGTYSLPVTRGLAQAKNAWAKQLALESASDGKAETLDLAAVLAQEKVSDRIFTGGTLPIYAKLEIARNLNNPDYLSYKAQATAQVRQGQKSSEKYASLLYLSGASSEQPAQELYEANEWLAQIASSLRALRFPKDPNQVRAALKFASDFSWVKELLANSVTTKRGPREVEGVAIVPLEDNVYIANAGRCRTFLVNPRGVRQISVAHDHAEPREEARAQQINDILGPRSYTRALISETSRPCTRPQITAVPATDLAQGYLISVTPGVIEHMGAKTWEKLLSEQLQCDLSSSRKQLEQAIVESGYPDAASLIIFRLLYSYEGAL